MTYNSSAVSVSIVTFNNADVVKERLDILLPIFKVDHIYDVFVVDNHSIDGTVDILKKFSEDEPLLKVILLDENKGFGYGHNQAIKQTSSEYHIVMNLDTTPKQKNVISNMKQYMDENQDIDLLSPLVLFPDGNIQYLTRSEPTVFDLAIRFLGPNWFKKRQEQFIHLNDGYDHEQVIKNATGSFMFLRTSTLKTIGAFDERYFLYMEDTDLTKAVNVRGRAVFSPEFKVIHEWQRGNHSIGGAKLMINSMVKYFNKWGWRLF
ncbi:glycosyltransferase [Leuconostoc mesenteroides]|uniref:glycosyltransferase n=1 Tax=Leuconostoc mesenteroides TaxID=1245 RepID=UPI00116D191B|nr:glycosyltransferase [Leuconostoc mesenteroides]GEA91525.1 glycosyl transferase family 2 [Leuconostoc mesenteroides subsp. mesenteroides]